MSYFPFYIARRYLFSRKSTNVINLISAVSVLGVAVSTVALVVTLSVFNGFHDMVVSFFTQFDPQLKIVPLEGKTAPADDPLLEKVKQMDAIEVATETVEDQALAIFGDKQAMVIVKGVDDNFAQLTHIDEILIGDGDFELRAGDLQYGTLGVRLAVKLGTGARFPGFLRIYAPRREGQLDMMNPQDAFIEDSLMSPGVVFNVKQAKYDSNYIIVPISFARSIFGQQGMISSLELRLHPGSDFDKTKKEIINTLGSRYEVLDRYEQQAETFKIMNIEKLLAYIFLTFILLVACFNIIGSLSMLIIDKKNDVITLHNMGATDSQIVKIFQFEGRLISLFGAIIGIVVGLLLCFLQEYFGIVKLGSSTGDFVVDAYPVSVHALDIVIIFITVLVVGFVAVWYPVRFMSRRLLSADDKNQKS